MLYRPISATELRANSKPVFGRKQFNNQTNMTANLAAKNLFGNYQTATHSTITASGLNAIRKWWWRAQVQEQIRNTFTKEWFLVWIKCSFFVTNLLVSLGPDGIQKCSRLRWPQILEPERSSQAKVFTLSLFFILLVQIKKLLSNCWLVFLSLLVFIFNWLTLELFKFRFPSNLDQNARDVSSLLPSFLAFFKKNDEYGPIKYFGYSTRFGFYLQSLSF